MPASVGIPMPARRILVFALLALTLLPGAALSRPVDGRSVALALQGTSEERSVQFEANRGQTVESVDFLARGPGYTLFLTPAEAVLSLRSESERDTLHTHERAQQVDRPRGLAADAAPVQPTVAAKSDVLRMRVMGSNAYSTVGEAELPGKVNYLLGDDPSLWRTGVATYGRVRYAAVYPDIDLVYYGQGAGLEYDFVLAPGAAPDQIRLRFMGADSLELDAAGDLLVHLPGGTVRQERPLIYQELEGRREPVAGGYVLVNTAAAVCNDHSESCSETNLPNEQVGDPLVAFWLGAYDVSRPLVIDPTLVYSTYLGGSGGESGRGIAVDGQGQPYITGETTSTDFPQAGGVPKGDTDVFVTKLSAAGTPLYTTYLGGSSSDQGNAIAVDRACMMGCSAFVTGVTYSADFPQVNSLPGPNNAVLQGSYTAFVTRLSAAGDMLLYSTYLGGSGTTYDQYPYCPPGSQYCDLGYWELPGPGDAGAGIAVDAQGQAYVTGSTYSSDFPLANSLPTGNSLRGDSDAFVAKLTAAGDALVYSTYLGGGTPGTAGGINSNTGSIDDDWGSAIAVDAQGHAYVTGYTASSGFPLVNPLASPANALRGGSDAFVAKLSSAGNALVYSTYLGGSDSDWGFGVAVDGQGQAYVTGQTSSPDFPLANNSPHGGLDAFVTKISATWRHAAVCHLCRRQR
jgi:hypothetical protein